MDNSKRRLTVVLALGIAAFLVLPWYRIDGGFYGFGWLAAFPAGAAVAPGVWQIFGHGRWWLAIPAVLMYNFFVRANKSISERLYAFGNDLLDYFATGSRVRTQRYGNRQGSAAAQASGS